MMTTTSMVEPRDDDDDDGFELWQWQWLNEIVLVILRCSCTRCDDGFVGLDIEF